MSFKSFVQTELDLDDSLLQFTYLTTHFDILSFCYQQYRYSTSRALAIGFNYFFYLYKELSEDHKPGAAVGKPCKSPSDFTQNTRDCINRKSVPDSSSPTGWLISHLQRTNEVIASNKICKQTRRLKSESTFKGTAGFPCHSRVVKEPGINTSCWQTGLVATSHRHANNWNLVTKVIRPKSCQKTSLCQTAANLVKDHGSPYRFHAEGHRDQHLLTLIVLKMG